MIVTSMRPGPGAASCAYTRLVPTIPTTANTSAIKCFVVMINLLKCPYSGSRARRSTIEQERDLFVRLVWDTETPHRNERDLVLLDDAALGLQGISKMPPSLTQTAQ